MKRLFYSMRQNKIKKITVWLVGIIACFLIGCGNKMSISSTDSPSIETTDSNYKEITIVEDLSYYEKLYPGCWLDMWTPFYYLDSTKKEGILSEITKTDLTKRFYKLNIPINESTIYIDQPLIRITEKRTPITIRLADFKSSDEIGFSIIGISIPQLVEWKPTDSTFEIVVALSPHNTYYPGNMKLEYNGKRYSGGMEILSEKGFADQVQYRFPISDQAEEAAIVLKEGSIWFDSVYHFIDAEEIQYDCSDKMELVVLSNE